MLCSVRPSASRLALSTLSGVPASAVTVIASRSTATIPVSWCGLSMIPSGAAIPVNEWPVPGIFTVVPRSRARATAATTSSVSRGVRTSVGVTEIRCAQFCQLVMPEG
jgi:hypothetical protein